MIEYKARAQGERRGPWRCARCFGRDSHLRGSPGVGAQIRKCSGCGMMDRRQVAERRVAPEVPRGRFVPKVDPVVPPWASPLWWTVLAVVATAAALVALGWGP